MAQQKITLNSIEIKQPDNGLQYSFETTYSSDSTRTENGVGHFTPLFTVESLSYSATGVKISEMTAILNIIAKGKSFTLHYFSPYYGSWRDDTFYVGQGNLTIGTLQSKREMYDSLSFQMTGVNPI